MNPFAAIDWPTIVAFVVVEALFVLLAAPWLIQRRNESRAVALFKTKLLPLLPAAPVVPSAADVAAAVRQAVLDVLPAAPSPEDHASFRYRKPGMPGSLLEQTSGASPPRGATSFYSLSPLYPARHTGVKCGW